MFEDSLRGTQTDLTKKMRLEFLQRFEHKVQRVVESRGISVE